MSGTSIRTINLKPIVMGSRNNLRHIEENHADTKIIDNNGILNSQMHSECRQKSDTSSEESILIHDKLINFDHLNSESVCRIVDDMTTDVSKNEIMENAEPSEATPTSTKCSDTFKQLEQAQTEYKKIIRSMTNVKSKQKVNTNIGIHLNGTFNKTLIFREFDDTFIPLNQNDVAIVTIAYTNTSDFFKIYDDHKSYTNIIIDSRLILHIMKAVVKYGDDILVYNAYSGIFKTVYGFYSELFRIQLSELTINNIKQISAAYILFQHVLKSVPGIDWNINTLIKHIRQSNDEYKNNNLGIALVDAFIKFVGIQKEQTRNIEGVRNISRIITENMSQKAYDSAFTGNVDLTTIEHITSSEVYAALMLLKSSSFSVYLNIDR